jgi:hypothetical protein
VGVAQARLERERRAGVAARAELDAEAEHAIGGEDAPRRGEQPLEVADVDEHVGGDDQVEALVARLEPGDGLGALEALVDAEGAGALEHAAGEVDTGQPLDARREQRPAQAGAAAEVERRRDSAAPARAGSRRAAGGRGSRGTSTRWASNSAE